MFDNDPREPFDIRTVLLGGYSIWARISHYHFRIQNQRRLAEIVYKLYACHSYTFNCLLK
jgi:hypothetical protein